MSEFVGSILIIPYLVLIGQCKKAGKLALKINKEKSSNLKKNNQLLPKRMCNNISKSKRKHVVALNNETYQKLKYISTEHNMFQNEIVDESLALLMLYLNGKIKV